MARPCRPSMGVMHAQVGTRKCSDQFARFQKVVRISRARKLQQEMTGRPARRDPHEKSDYKEWIVREEICEKVE